MGDTLMATPEDLDTGPPRLHDIARSIAERHDIALRRVSQFMVQQWLTQSTGIGSGSNLSATELNAKSVFETVHEEALETSDTENARRVAYVLSEMDLQPGMTPNSNGDNNANDSVLNSTNNGSNNTTQQQQQQQQPLFSASFLLNYAFQKASTKVTYRGRLRALKALAFLVCDVMCSMCGMCDMCDIV